VMPNLPESRESLASDLLDHFTSVKTLKQLFITLVLITNIAGIYDVVFNNAAGVRGLIQAYLSINRYTPPRAIRQRDLEFIDTALADYPGTRVTVFELNPDAGFESVVSYVDAQKIVLYDSGIPIAVLAINPPVPQAVLQLIFNYFRGYEDINSSILEPTP